MSLFRAIVLLVCGLALAATAQAGVFYKYFDKDGNMVITDTPYPGAEKIETKPVMTMPFPKGQGDAPAADKPKKAAAEGYMIVIQSPADQSTYQRHGDPIAVAVSVSPSLHGGDSLKMLIDGKEISDSTKSSIEPDGLERGAHQFTARVVDADGAVLKESSATFYIHQQSTLLKSKAGP